MDIIAVLLLNYFIPTHKLGIHSTGISVELIFDTEKN